MFDIRRLRKQINLLEKKKYEHFIGVDDYSGDISAYVLMRRGSDGNSEFLIGKKMKDGPEFLDEVNFLAKIFNAKIVR